jgi:7-carboxy-7-deazaguanine synthase
VIRVSELFESIQGEGPGAGEPCSFVRLAGCDLRCSWCDSSHAWENTGVEPRAPAELAVWVRAAGSRRVVITGGEPLEQQPSLTELVALLPRELPVDVETNGTIVPVPELFERVARWMVSPKLSSSGLPLERRVVADALVALRDSERAWLKLVVHTDSDIREAAALVCQLHWPQELVLLMPLAGNRVEYRERAPKVADACVALGYGFSPRLQLELWDGARGR